MTVKIVTTMPRRNKSPVVVGDVEYVFEKDKKGRFIAEVDEQHAKVLLKSGIYYRDGDAPRAPTTDDLGFRAVATAVETAPPVNEANVAAKATQAAQANPWFAFSLEELRAVYSANINKDPGTLGERALANHLLKAGILPTGAPKQPAGDPLAGAKIENAFGDDEA